MRPLPTWEEVTQAVTIVDGVIRVVDLRATFGTSIARRMTGGQCGGTVTAAQIRAACDLDASTETIGVAARRVGLSFWELRTELKRRGLIRTHDGHKGAAWNRIPKGVADKIAAMRGAK